MVGCMDVWMYGCMEVRFFDVSWLSGYAEEQERIFIGGRYKMELQTIIIIETANNYKKLFAAFYKLDMILSGSPSVCLLDISQNDINIVEWFFSYILGDAENENKFDSFVKNSFYFYAQKKTQIVLNLHYLSLVKNQDFIALVMNKIERTGEYDWDNYKIKSNKIPSTSTNLFRGCLLRIFGNLKEIILYSTAGGYIYSFNILKLLSILEEVELPKSFKTITIKDDWRTGWLEEAFSKEVEKTFALKNLKIELKSAKEIVITV